MRERHDEARETRMSSRTSPQARHTERLTRKKSGGLTHKDDGEDSGGKEDRERDDGR